jgi:hypothetical protein
VQKLKSGLICSALLTLKNLLIAASSILLNCYISSAFIDLMATFIKPYLIHTCCLINWAMLSVLSFCAPIMLPQALQVMLPLA